MAVLILGFRTAPSVWVKRLLNWKLKRSRSRNSYWCINLVELNLADESQRKRNHECSIMVFCKLKAENFKIDSMHSTDLFHQLQTGSRLWCDWQVNLTGLLKTVILLPNWSSFLIVRCVWHRELKIAEFFFPMDPFPLIFSILRQMTDGLHALFHRCIIFTVRFRNSSNSPK